MPPQTRRPAASAQQQRRTETIFQSAVIDLIRYRHLWYYHIPDSRLAPAGWPDLTIIGPGGILFRELKTATGRLRTQQRHIIDILTAIHEDVDVWRPDDLTSGRIIRELDVIRWPRLQLQPDDLTWLVDELSTIEDRNPSDDPRWCRCRTYLEQALKINIQRGINE